MRTKIFILFTLSCLLIFNCSKAQTSGNEKSIGWPIIENQMKPWTRWWWMGNAVKDKDLELALEQYSQAGIGGVEITPIYGAVGFENRYISFLSPEWIAALHFTVTKANSLGMGVDMNTGTGWPFGGPQIKPENAATKLITRKFKLNGGEKLSEPIEINERDQDFAKLQALTAYSDKGEVLNLLPLVQDNKVLNWSPTSGQWEIYAAFAGKTHQKVKRAAPGGEGFTLDHLDGNSVNIYLKRFTDAFAKKPPGVRAFFNDSYEVFGATWTPTFLAHFKKARRYDLEKYIRELVESGNKANTNETVARLKSDYRETMDELLLENFTQNWTSWAHSLKSLTKNQSHGSPGNLLDLYGAVDIPETEIFGSSYFPIGGLRRDAEDIRNVDPDPIMSKFASSAAHTGGKALTSSETFTWLTEHFKTSFSQCKPEVEKLFLSGVNHIFYHGTTNSPSDIPWPGWLFYASMEMNPNNSLWPQVNGLNDYISRCQSILQSGKSDNELLIYWPVYDIWNNPAGMDMALKVHDVDKWLHPSSFYKLSKQLSKVGYSFDFASDRILKKTEVNNKLLRTSAEGSEYKVLIVPECEMMNPETLDKIIGLANNGATVIFQQLPKDVPGLSDLEERRRHLKASLSRLTFKNSGLGFQQYATGKGNIFLGNNIEGILNFNKIKRETLIDSGLEFTRRKIASGKYYYLVNHSAKTIDTIVTLNEKGHVTILDPQTGAIGTAAKSENKVRVQISSGETLFLKVEKNPKTGATSWIYLDKPGKALLLNKQWILHFTKGGPELPADQTLASLGSWTDSGDPKSIAFSGTGVYSSVFDLEAKSAKEYILDLGTVNESARVWINGQEIGILWSIPFKARIGKFLIAGENTIKIEVVNLMANRIRDMDIKKIKWKNYHEINFVNINYKDFDAAEWNIMPSGLSGPITITPYY